MKNTDPLFLASQVSAKKVHYARDPSPEDHTILALYTALEDRTRELKALSLKLSLLEELEPTASAASAYAQLMQRLKS